MGGAASILVVEDNDVLREIIVDVLSTAGYSVLPAESAAQALQHAARADQAIDLVITDAVLPDLSGRILIEKLRPRQALVISGHDQAFASPSGRGRQFQPAFLGKPFTSAELLGTVRRLLDAAGEAP